MSRNITSPGVRSARRDAYWVSRPSRNASRPYYYRQRDGALFTRRPNVSAAERVFTSDRFTDIAPLKVYFDFTNRCNLTCAHCITSSSPDVDVSSELPPDRIVELVDEMADYGVLEIATGGGEPLVHPQCFDLFSAVVSRGMNLIITTNGLRLNEPRTQRLAALKPLEVRVSFDGGPQLHDQIRGPNTYNRALRGLRHLTQSGIPSAARLTMCAGMERELDVLLRDLGSTGVGRLKVALIKRTGRAARAGAAHLLRDQPVNSRFLNDLTERAAAFGLTTQYSSDDFPMNAETTHDTKLRDSETPNCGAGLDNCHITPRGQLLGCIAIPDLGFGDLKRTSFREVWGGHVARQYRLAVDATSARRLCDVSTLLTHQVDSTIEQRLIPLEIIRSPGKNSPPNA